MYGRYPDDPYGTFVTDGADGEKVDEEGGTRALNPAFGAMSETCVPVYFSIAVD